MRRYTEHPAASSDPRLVAYWESLRRGEAEHRALLEDWLRTHGADLGETESGVGAAAPRAGTEGGARAGNASDRAAEAVSGGAEAADRAAPGGARGHARDLAALRRDFDFETAAVKRYGQMAAEASEQALTTLFTELVRGEAGHRRGLRRMIAVIEDPETPVLLFCPLCGWQLDFGPQPAEGTEAKCPMCPGRFALHLDAGGNWTLERQAP